MFYKQKNIFTNIYYAYVYSLKKLFKFLNNVMVFGEKNKNRRL